MPEGLSWWLRLVKNLPAMQETQVQSLGGEDPLEKGMEPIAVILAWRTPWTEEPGGYSPEGCEEADTAESTQHAQLSRNHLLDHPSI